MSLHDFFKHNYAAACDMQRGIEGDDLMKKMIKQRNIDPLEVIQWMRGYNLCQGIKNEDRLKVANVYSQLILRTPFSKGKPKQDEIIDRIEILLVKFFDEVPRKWLSAASKLLWCSYPDKVVIYDAFVERALTVLQPTTDYLAEFPRIGTIGTVKSYEDIVQAVAYYKNYQDMVNAIYKNHQDQLSLLRTVHGETYEHDIRIVDKLLWMIGRPRQSFQLGPIKCRA